MLAQTLKQKVLNSRSTFKNRTLAKVGVTLFSEVVADSFESNGRTSSAVDSTPEPEELVYVIDLSNNANNFNHQKVLQTITIGDKQVPIENSLVQTRTYQPNLTTTTCLSNKPVNNKFALGTPIKNQPITMYFDIIHNLVYIRDKQASEFIVDPFDSILQWFVNQGAVKPLHNLTPEILDNLNSTHASPLRFRPYVNEFHKSVNFDDQHCFVAQFDIPANAVQTMNASVGNNFFEKNNCIYSIVNIPLDYLTKFIVHPTRFNKIAEMTIEKSNTPTKHGWVKNIPLMLLGGAMAGLAGTLYYGGGNIQNIKRAYDIGGTSNLLQRAKLMNTVTTNMKQPLIWNEGLPNSMRQYMAHMMTQHVFPNFDNTKYEDMGITSYSDARARDFAKQIDQDQDTIVHINYGTGGKVTANDRVDGLFKGITNYESKINDNVKKIKLLLISNVKLSYEPRQEIIHALEQNGLVLTEEQKKNLDYERIHYENGNEEKFQQEFATKLKRLVERKEPIKGYRGDEPIE